jgi:acyl-coenzyme A synthetase/AMP-(fatty) acid ligase/thioesterase domain-containing protein
MSESTDWCRVEWLPPSARCLDYNGPSGRYTRLDPDFVDEPMFSAFSRVAQQFADKVAIVDRDRSLTYRELLAVTAKIGHDVSALTPPGGAVGILMPNSARFAAAILGCLAAGRPYVALDTRYPAARNQTVIEDAGLALLIVDDVQRDAGLLLPTKLRQLRVSDTIAGDGAPLSPSVVDDPAVILYTSGSTGRPKGIVNSQRAILQRILQHVEASHLSSEDVFLLSTSFCTIAGTREGLTPLFIGGKLVIVDPETEGLRAMLTAAREHQASITYVLPALMRSLIELDKEGTAFCGMRVVRLGGDRVLWNDISRLRRTLPADCHIQVAYSSTETTGTQWFVPPDWPQTGPVAPVGYVLPGISFTIANEDAAAVPGEGELVVRSPYVALGIWDNGRCVPGPFTSDSGDPSVRIFRTGDIVKMDDGGLIEVIGRKDRLIKINGKRVEPAELEVFLRRCPGVADAAVVVRREMDEASLVAFVVPAENEAGGAEFRTRLVETMRTALSVPLRPARLHVVSALPQLPSGKLDGQALQELDRSAYPSDIGQQRPFNVGDLEQIDTTVQRLWDALLRHPAAASHRSWAEGGGDSLKFLRLIFELEETLHCNIPIDHFRIDMTAAEFSATLCDILTGTKKPDGNRAGSPIFLFPGLSGDYPALAEIRASLEPIAHVVAIAYPSWREMLHEDGTIEGLAKAALTQITRIAPEGDVRFISYSFGAAAALVAAAHLTAQGRRIGFFGVIDGNISASETFAAQDRLPTFGEIGRVTRGLLARGDSFQHRGCQLTARWLVGLSGGRFLSWLAHRRLDWLPTGARFTFERELEEAMRHRAFAAWVSQASELRLAAAAVLFRSQQERPGAPPDLGWAKHFAALEIVEVTGNHLEMLQSPHRERLCARLTEKIVQDAAAHFPHYAHHG